MGNLESLRFILPEIILAGFSLVVLMTGAFSRRKDFLSVIALVGVAIAAWYLPANAQPGAVFFNMLVNDSLSIFFRRIILFITTLIIIFSVRRGEWDEEDQGAYYFFLLFIGLSMMLATSTNNLIMIYVALEAVSIIGYIMAGSLKREVFSSEAGLKYFLFGAVSTGITLYGISLVYGLFGTLDLGAITAAIQTGAIRPAALIVIFGLVLVGLGFKCSLVPFHMWTPDVYQGAPTPVAALLSVGPKAMGFALLLRVFLGGVQPTISGWPCWAGIIAIVSITLGNITALKQNDIKRLLAYSTIAQAGFIFLGLAVATPEGIQAALFYIFVYTIMNLGAFGAVIAISSALRSQDVKDYAGFYRRDPFLAIILAVSLLSLAGIPPFAGFMAKFLVLASAVKANQILLAVLASVNSVIALYYYLRVVKFMFLDEPSPKPFSPAPKVPALQLVLVLTLVLNILLGLWPQPVLSWIAGLLSL